MVGAEAALIRGAIGMMVDTHVAELRDDAEPWAYGIDWFDQWDAPQRLWLLEKVTLAMLGGATIDPAAAIFDAAADAIFYEINDLIQIEIQQEPLAEQELLAGTKRSWRQSVLEAFESQTHRRLEMDPRSTDLDSWQTTVTRIADSILGVRLYQRAENFRDGDFKRIRTFLNDRGLPSSYLSQIPPLRSVDQVQRSIDRIQLYVFR